MLFAEAVDNSKSLDVTYCRMKETGSCHINVYSDTIEVQNANKTHQVTLNGLNISCMTCKNLCLVNDGTLSCRFNASYSSHTNDNIIKLSKIKSNLNAADSILCKFCQQKLGNIQDVTCTINFQKFITLEDEGLCIEGGYFCHPTTKSVGDSATNSVNTQTFPVNFDLASPSSCLFTGLELMIDRSLVEPKSIQSKGNDFFHCSSCLMALGKKVLYGSQEYFVFWANCLSLLIRENDIDGDFIGYIEKPLIADEMEFYGLLVDNLIRNTQYRVILSAITWDGLLDFMLLWLPDQKLRLYTTALQDCTSPTIDVNESSLGKDEQNTVHSVKIEPIACRRVFYQQLLPNSNCSLNTAQLVDSWRKDFGVTLIHMPWETCIGFSACLSQFSSRIAPHTRKLDGPMMGFMSGAVPLIHLPNDLA
ncbi:unnamed protein product [Schistosoma rodhaini]|uniref:HECT-type E3 ubiquitin transferase E3D n=1 Tax=Schistosoma rodhaini TaxID=6188 RepID=A0AA85G661_9TREM|nr:unnamed protein product [Schistosoma rodhaini]CAH8608507.1 unnamed protein product [Schistosoma rodhaini]